MSNIPTIKLAPDVLGQIGPISITSSMVSVFTVSAIMIILALILRRKLSLKPGRAQMILEMMVNLILDSMTRAFDSEKRARKFFPLMFTIFTFLIFSNYFGLIPLLDSIVIGDGVKVFSTPTAHYSLTITLALIMIGAASIFSFILSPLGYIGNFIRVKPLWEGLKELSPGKISMSFIDIFLGCMDIIGEIAKIISISTRLFGNMFAGGVIILIVSNLSAYTQFVVPLPFSVLGLITGIVQAFVFATLGILFISGLANSVKPGELEINKATN